jgi:hypothetical protein
MCACLERRNEQSRFKLHFVSIEIVFCFNFAHELNYFYFMISSWVLMLVSYLDDFDNISNLKIKRQNVGAMQDQRYFLF